MTDIDIEQYRPYCKSQLDQTLRSEQGDPTAGKGSFEDNDDANSFLPK